MLLQNKNITNEQAELLTAIDLPLSRITRINKNLLLLAKIENKQFAEVENIELTEVINETLELLSDYTTLKQISVDENFSEKLFLSCNKTLLEILVNNTYQCHCSQHRTRKNTNQFSNKTLTISNTGKTALSNEKLFERFTISSSETANSGLGLAIVKEICNRLQLAYSLHFLKIIFILFGAVLKF